MRVTLGVGVTRAGVDELITGLWSFANALGLLTDVIGERTAAAGVTVDGLLVKDAGIPQAAVTAHEAALAILESQITDGTILARLAAAEVISGGWRFSSSVDMNATLEMTNFGSASNAILRSDVVGDAFDRFALHVDGIMQWGNGASARDTVLRRTTINALLADCVLEVADNFRPLNELELSVRDVSLSAQANNLSIGSNVVQRITASAPLTITGFAGGASGKMIHVVTIGANRLRITHEGTASTAANRVITPNQLNMDLEEGDSAILVYDSTTNRWRVSASTKII